MKCRYHYLLKEVKAAYREELHGSEECPEDYASLYIQVLCIILCKEFGWKHNRKFMGKRELQIEKLVRLIDKNLEYYQDTFGGDEDAIYPVLVQRLSLNYGFGLVPKIDQDERTVSANITMAIALEVLLRDFLMSPKDCDKILRKTNEYISTNMELNKTRFAMVNYSPGMRNIIHEDMKGLEIEDVHIHH